MTCRRRRWLLAAMAVAVWSVLGCAGPPPGSGVAPADAHRHASMEISFEELPRVRGTERGRATTVPRGILGPAGPDVVVVVFVTTTCPIANATMPSIRRLHEHATVLDADLVLVHPDPLVTPTEVWEHAERRGLAMDVLLDRELRLARMLDARVVPEAFVLHRTDAGWNIRYRGPIDDLYADVGRRRRAASEFHAQDALERVRSGRPIEPAHRTAHGCLIERTLDS